MKQELQRAILRACARFIRRSLEPFERAVADFKARVDTIERAVSPESILTRVQDAVAKVALPRGEKGDPGERGEKGEPGQRGEAGERGAGITIEEVRPVIESIVRSLPPATPGERGEKGEVGEKGERGDIGPVGASLTPADMRPMVEELVRAIPVPKDGTSVTVDDVMPALERLIEAKAATWALDFERRAADVLQRAVDRLPAPAPGKDGRDGIDGLGFDDMAVDYDGERTVTLRFARGDKVREHNLILPVVLDRGVFKDGATYVPGDGVTWAGSYWIAQRSTSAKPETSDDWRMAVRKGRDGKNGERGRDFRGGPVGVAT